MDRTQYKKWLDDHLSHDPELISECLKIVEESDVQDVSPVMVLRIVSVRRKCESDDGDLSNVPFSSE